MAVVIAAAVVALLFFIGAWLVVGTHGRGLLPKVHHDHEPNSYLQQPGPSSQAA